MNATNIVNANNFNSRVATGTQPYACTSTSLNTNLNADLLDGYHEWSFLRYRDSTTTSGASTLWNQIGIRSYHNALPEGLSGLYNYGQAISFPGNGSRLDIFTNHTGSTDTVNQGLWWRSGWNDDKRTWRRIIDSGNIGSQSVSYATSAGNADTTDGVHIEWAGSQAASDTTWVVGWNANGTKLKAVKRADLSVNYASSAGNADTVDGQHFNWNNNKNDHTYLWAASSNGQAYLVHRASMSVNYASSAGSANWLNVNSTLTYGASGLNYFNISGAAGNTKANNTPTSAWYHVLRMNHGNSGGYLADIAVPLNDVGGVWWRQIRNGAFYGWYKLLDNNNSAVSGGGSSGGSSITVNLGGTSKTLTIPTSLPANGGTSSNVVVNSSDANSTYRMVWHSGNTLYGTNNIYCNPSAD